MTTYLTIKGFSARWGRDSIAQTVTLQGEGVAPKGWDKASSRRAVRRITIGDGLTVYSEDIDGVVDVLHDGGIFNFKCHRDDAEPSDGFLSDAEADADALKSAGWGSDEDYDHYSYDNE